MTPIISPVRRRLMLLMLLPFSILCWSFADDFFMITKEIDIFSSVYKEVNQYYVDDVNPGQLMKTGVDAMLKTLDPYTNYYPEAEIEDYRMKHVSTEYGGIGASSFRMGDSIIIYNVYEGFPAQLADIRAGDVLLAVNGRSIKGLAPEEIDDLIKGQAGTTVKLEFSRLGETQPIEKTVTRGEIKVKNVSYYGMLNDSVGYIKLDKFLQNCFNEVHDALVELQKNPGLKSLVFDLRGNGGGLLEESVQMLNLFIKKGELLVTQTGKTEGSNNVYHAKVDPIAPDIRVAVLVDKNSASASEITAGNFQDLDRGVVIGQRSYGKGLVQQTRPLSFNAQMKLTVAKYFTASGRCVQTRIYHHGVEDGGAVTEVPDSLMKPFKTKNGRTVFDGSAVYPDRYVAPGDTSNIARSLSRNLIIFDYATHFRQKHDSIAAADEFVFSDNDYQDFVSYINTRKFDYSTQTESAFATLKKTVQREKYYAGISNELEALGKGLNHDKAEDLKLFKAELKSLIEQEIVPRYHFQTGKFKYMFRHDQVMKEALLVLGNPTLYNAILKGEGEYNVIGKPKK
ncbi:MAG: S41 family peptidase [Bacteroidetes bacterium]|nr:S41 family peptidase [Bacteroidota bacterium]